MKYRTTGRKVHRRRSRTPRVNGTSEAEEYFRDSRDARLVEKFWTWLAWHLPKPLAYWATIRLGVHATTGSEHG